MSAEAAGAGERPASLRRSVADRAVWRTVAFFLLSLPLGVAYFVLLVTAIVAAAAMAVTIVGLPFLYGALLLWRGLARLERRRAQRMLGLDLGDAHLPLPDHGAVARARVRVVDPATWRDLAYLLALFPVGIITGITAIVLVTVPLIVLGAPFGLSVRASLHALAAMRTGQAALARSLLGGEPDPRVLRRLRGLHDSRARLVEAADAERRRLERDLHDGAQQRLVSLSLTLGMLRRGLPADAAAAELAERAQEEAKQAIAELRTLARGLHPAILTERGLAAALADLVRRSPIPADLLAAPEGRLPQAAESAAYFLASEAIANAAKHARASSLAVLAERRGDLLMVEVRDDGAGGAHPSPGSGLAGLADRLEALDGRLEVESPPGRGTLVRGVIPIALG